MFPLSPRHLKRSTALLLGSSTCPQGGGSGGAPFDDAGPIVDDAQRALRAAGRAPQEADAGGDAAAGAGASPSGGRGGGGGAEPGVPSTADARQRQRADLQAAILEGIQVGGAADQVPEQKLEEWLRFTGLVGVPLVLAVWSGAGRNRCRLCCCTPCALPQHQTLLIGSQHHHTCTHVHMS